MKIAKLTLLTLFATLIFAMTSCERDANFLVEDGESKLHVISEITPTEKIKVFIKTSIGANTEDEFFYPKQGDAQVVLFEEGVPLENPGFRYNAAQGAFVSQGSFRPTVGLEYSLEVSLSDNDIIRPIFGTTFIPEPDTALNVSVFDQRTTIIDNNLKRESFEINMDFLNTKSNYFLVKYEAELDDEAIAFSINDVLEGDGGVYFSKSLNGLLIDKTKFTDQVRLTLETTNMFSTSQEIEFLDLELRTITKEAFQFHIAYSKQLSAQQVAISEPVISYTNFEEGLGLFTGYSSSFYRVIL